MEIKATYTTAEVAELERVTPETLRRRIYRDPDRYPGYDRGMIPLADVKRRFRLSTDDLREL